MKSKASKRLKKLRRIKDGDLDVSIYDKSSRKSAVLTIKINIPKESELYAVYNK